MSKRTKMEQIDSDEKPQEVRYSIEGLLKRVEFKRYTDIIMILTHNDPKQLFTLDEMKELLQNELRREV